MQRETQVTNASYELTAMLLLLLMLANSNDKNGLNVVVAAVVVRVIPERNARRAYEVRVLPYRTWTKLAAYWLCSSNAQPSEASNNNKQLDKNKNKIRKKKKEGEKIEKLAHIDDASLTTSTSLKRCYLCRQPQTQPQSTVGVREMHTQLQLLLLSQLAPQLASALRRDCNSNCNGNGNGNCDCEFV